HALPAARARHSPEGQRNRRAVAGAVAYRRVHRSRDPDRSRLLPPHPGLSAAPLLLARRCRMATPRPPNLRMPCALVGSFAACPRPCNRGRERHEPFMFKWLASQFQRGDEDPDSLGSEKGLERFIAALPVTVPARTVEALGEPFETARALDLAP